MTTLISVDLGNESGRVMRVTYDGEHIRSEQVYRFSNEPVTVAGTYTWDVLRLWHEVERGLAQALTDDAAGIGITSFGVDFGLLDAAGALIANPVHMRDRRTHGMMDWVFSRVPREDIFARTGVGIYVINTLYQLAALRQHSPWQLDAAHTLLTMPNLFNYWLTGERLSEFTHTTTTQCYNPTLADWDRPLLEQLDLPTHILPPIVQPGTQVGSYRGVPVFAVASHDTASAVVAVPAATERYAYISSGTWSLFGIETRAPFISDAVRDASFTNEGGAFGTYRLLRMVMGLWLLQSSRNAWSAQNVPTYYGGLLQSAADSAAFASLIDPDNPLFFTPGDTPARIRHFCQISGQTVPRTQGAVVRCIFESLALKYRHVLNELIAVTGQLVDVIHIVGGGAQNPLLCQMTADATGRPVLAEPVEAATLGSGLVQLIALGELRDLAQARELVRRSFPPILYEPHATSVWDDAYDGSFERLLHFGDAVDGGI